jgi:hypothetical protein
VVHLSVLDAADLSLAHSDSSRKLTMIKEEFERNRHTLESRPAFTTLLMYWVRFARKA